MSGELTVADPGDGNTLTAPSGVGWRCNLTSVGAAETRVLGPPEEDGQTLTLTMTVDAGDIVLTFGSTLGKWAATYNALLTAITDVTFDAIGQTLTVRSVNENGTLYWNVVSMQGAVIQ